MEPAGALAIAGATKYLRQHGLTGATVAAVMSGANMDFDRLRFVSERADSSETLISVTIPEAPGACCVQSCVPCAFIGVFKLIRWCTCSIACSHCKSSKEHCSGASWLFDCVC